MKMLVNVIGNNFHSGAIRRQISKHVNAVAHKFVLSCTANEILTFETFDLEKAIKGH